MASNPGPFKHGERVGEEYFNSLYILSLSPPLIQYPISSIQYPISNIQYPISGDPFLKAPSVQLQPIHRIMHFQTLLLFTSLTLAFALPQSAEDATTPPVKLTVADVAAMCSQLNPELFCCEKTAGIGCIVINTSVDGTCLPFPSPSFWSR